MEIWKFLRRLVEWLFTTIVGKAILISMADNEIYPERWVASMLESFNISHDAIVWFLAGAFGFGITVLFELWLRKRERKQTSPRERKKMESSHVILIGSTIVTIVGLTGIAWSVQQIRKEQAKTVSEPIVSSQNPVPPVPPQSLSSKMEPLNQPRTSPAAGQVIFERSPVHGMGLATVPHGARVEAKDSPVDKSQGDDGGYAVEIRDPPLGMASPIENRKRLKLGEFAVPFTPDDIQARVKAINDVLKILDDDYTPMIAELSKLQVDWQIALRPVYQPNPLDDAGYATTGAAGEAARNEAMQPLQKRRDAYIKRLQAAQKMCRNNDEKLKEMPEKYKRLTDVLDIVRFPTTENMISELRTMEEKAHAVKDNTGFSYMEHMRTDAENFRRAVELIANWKEGLDQRAMKLRKELAGY